mmetsp:Transcript_17902/g.21915  ORF Transcript_17902/g.21915 Transcript_17902/m.21915 type:complete len:116 (-) Transcript_17902:229-576(-)
MLQDRSTKVHEGKKKEISAALFIERIYRGHIGRKVTRRWASKKSEIEAINALMNASAVCMQRMWRGHSGRNVAKQLRKEMTEFIACIRIEEAKADEIEYWKTHKVARFKKKKNAK